ncbi:MAG: hypothetical protein ACRDKI_10810 [Solirubrobacterales bacterium]
MHLPGDQILHATNRALQIALLVPILASLFGLFNSFRMLKHPDVSPAEPFEASLV